MEAPQCSWEIEILYPDNEKRTFTVAPGPLPLRSQKWRCASLGVTFSPKRRLEELRVVCYSGRRGGSLRTTAVWQQGTGPTFVPIHLGEGAPSGNQSHSIFLMCKPR